MPAESETVAYPYQRVLIIGGGPSGLVTLRNLVQRGNFPHVRLYERRDDIGGVWYFEERDIPTSNPTDDVSTTQSKPRWPSPAYDGLIGNVLPEFLSFSGHPFPHCPTAPSQPFPTLQETHNYLRSFAKPLLSSGIIQLNRNVIRVEERPKPLGGWRVVYTDWSDSAKGREVVEIWDAVVICVGWFDHPVWPDTSGLDALRSAGIARHTKSWRGPRYYDGSGNLVIGNANSANEVAAHLAPVAKSPVYQSVRRPAFPGFPSLPDERIAAVPPVVQYLLKPQPSGCKFDALLADGSRLNDLDYVHVGTGYKPFPDFVHVYREGSMNLVPLVTEEVLPHRVPFLHRHIIYAYNPSLEFVGAVVSYTPFILADLVSTWLSLAWKGRIRIPDTVDGRLAWERERLARIQAQRRSTDNPSVFLGFSFLRRDEQAYAEMLREEVTSACPALDATLALWNDERTAVRESMSGLKLKTLYLTKDSVSSRVEP